MSQIDRFLIIGRVAGSLLTHNTMGIGERIIWPLCNSSKGAHKLDRGIYRYFERHFGVKGGNV
jgi:hypothetical protein